MSDRSAELVDAEAERLLLGAATSDPAAWFEHVFPLAPSDLAGPGHAELHAAAQDHARDGKPLELVALGGTLRDRSLGHLQALLAECADAYLAAVESPRLPAYAERVRQLAHLRRIDRTARRLPGLLVDPELELEERVEQATARFFEALESRHTHSLGTAAVLADEVGQLFDHRQEARERGELSRIVRTGSSQLDAALGGGLAAGRFTVEGARSSYGKSTHGQDVSLAAALGGHPTLFVALESTRMEVFLALLQKVSGLAPYDVREGLADGVELDAALDELRELPLLVESGRFNLKMLAALIRRARAVHRVELVVVDYLQLVENKLRGQTRATEVSGVTAELKALAMELEIAVLGLAQLNKGPEEREGGVPRLRDLRESEAIAHDADQVLFLVRPDLHGRHEGPYLTLAKNRHGRTVERIPLDYDPARNRYRDALRAVA